MQKLAERKNCQLLQGSELPFPIEETDRLIEYGFGCYWGLKVAATRFSVINTFQLKLLSNEPQFFERVRKWFQCKLLPGTIPEKCLPQGKCWLEFAVQLKIESMFFDYSGLKSEVFTLVSTIKC